MIGRKMPVGSIYQLRVCGLCGKPNEKSCYSARSKYHASCLKTVEKSWGRKTKSKIPYRFMKMKKNASRRGITFSLTFEQYAILVCGNKCSYCSEPLPVLGGGIDRKNFKKGYEPGNCVSCCARCNDLKGKLELCGFSYDRVLQLLDELNCKPGFGGSELEG